MDQQFRHVSRREFLAVAATTTAFATGVSPLLAADTADTISFFLVGDTHYFADRESPSKLNDRSALVTSQLIKTLNELPGSDIPENASGGKVMSPQGVIHAGDLIDSGDKSGTLHEAMQQTEWDAFAADYGAKGGEGKLKFPTYEVHGNHDGPGGKGLAIEGIIKRNERRPNLTHVSSNGLHYSWNWGAVHFINLGIVVGATKDVAQKRRYNPLESLDFLIADLHDHVEDKSQPIVITQHIDVARYTTACDNSDAANLGKEWNPCDVRAFYNALDGHNVVADLCGHTHARSVAIWNGETAKATEGISLYNVDNSSHFGSDSQAFLYFEISPSTVVVRECATKDAWKSHFWTPQVWRREYAT